MIELLNERIFVSCLAVLVVTQLIKVIGAYRNGTLSIHSFFETGGMPSSHSALVSALTLSVYFEQGLSPLFMVCIVFAAIVIRDAFGVRQATGQNTQVLKQLIATLKLERKIQIQNIREILGHTPFQVTIGICIGLLTAVIVHYQAEVGGLLMLIAVSLYYVAPGLLANTAPILSRKVDLLNIPVDFGRSWNGKRIFGSHKTYRGFLFGIMTAIALVYLQILLYKNGFFRDISFVNYSWFGLWDVLLLGFLLGFGALFGDLVKSFFKRRLNIAPGKTFFPWDQLDYVIGILAFVWIFKSPTLPMTVTLLILAPIAHMLFTLIGYYLDLKEQKI